MKSSVAEIPPHCALLVLDPQPLSRDCLLGMLSLSVAGEAIS